MFNECQPVYRDTVYVKFREFQDVHIFPLCEILTGHADEEGNVVGKDGIVLERGHPNFNMLFKEALSDFGTVLKVIALKEGNAPTEEIIKFVKAKK